MNEMYSSKMQAAFHEEAVEILIELETSLMELEENPLDKKMIDQVFRALHTLKGSGSMFGFDDIAAFAHEIESVFDLVRKGEISITGTLINITLSAGDQLSLMLEGEGSDDEITRLNRILIDQLKELTDSDKEMKLLIPENKTEKDQSQSIKVYRIRFKPEMGIFLQGTNPLNLLNELRAMGDCRIIAHVKNLPDFADLNNEHCYIFWDIILATGQGIDAIRDVFIFVEDDCELKIEIIGDDTSKKLGEILVERGEVDAETLESFLIKQDPIGEMLTKAGLTDKAEINSALAEQTQVRKIKETREKLQKESSIRVGSGKLDKLVNMVGELITIQTGFNQNISDKKIIEIQSFVEEIERITFDLRDISMSLRMIPIGTTFSRYKRLIHDLSLQLGKKIKLVTEGSETQLDATIIERLVEPLIHLIRNSVDHGIEKIEERENLGKNPTGIIHLSATHSGGSILIQVKDDGAGLDPETLLEKAIKKGIVPKGPIPTEKEIFKLIFAPGFSTAKEITGVSGRGVGMDVVKKTIDELGGIIDIESKKGEGTLFTIKIPLTLAIIRGLLVRISSEYFIVPLSSVEKYIEIEMTEAERLKDSSQINDFGTLIPYVNLRNVFLLQGRTPDIGHIVIVNSENKRTGLLVDEVVGEQQTVVKNLGFIYKNVEGISGATILGNGKIGLILDVFKLVNSSQSIREAV